MSSSLEETDMLISEEEPSTRRKDLQCDIHLNQDITYYDPEELEGYDEYKEKEREKCENLVDELKEIFKSERYAYGEDQELLDYDRGLYGESYSESLISCPSYDNIDRRPASKIRMFYRKPTFLPRDKTLMAKYDEQLSYFSEKLAKEQQKLQYLNECVYMKKPNAILKQYRGSLLKKLQQPASIRAVNSVAFSSCADYLAIGFGSGDIQVYGVDYDSFISPITEVNQSSILCVRWHPDYRKYLFLNTLKSGMILLCQYVDSNWTLQKYKKEKNNEIETFDFNASGTKMVTGGKDASLREYDFNTGQIVNTYTRYDMDCERLTNIMVNDLDDEGDGHYRRIYAVKFRDGDETTFLSGGIDNSVKIWDLRLPSRPVRNIFGPHICGDALDVMDTKVLTGQWTFCDSVELWDLRTSGKLHTMKPENRQQILTNEFPLCCKFIRHWDRIDMGDVLEDLVLVGGSGFGALEVQSLNHDLIVHSFVEKGPITTIAQYEDLLVYGTSTNVLGLCCFGPSKMCNGQKLFKRFTFDNLILPESIGEIKAAAGGSVRTTSLVYPSTEDSSTEVCDQQLDDMRCLEEVGDEEYICEDVQLEEEMVRKGADNLQDESTTQSSATSCKQLAMDDKMCLINNIFHLTSDVEFPGNSNHLQ